MATSGKINGIVYKKNGTAVGPYNIWIEWKRTTYSVTNGTSTINIALYTARNDGYKGESATDQNPIVKLIIDNQTLINTTSIPLQTTGTSNSNPQEIFNKSFTLKHDLDGTYSKSIVASVDPDAPDSYGLGTVSGTLDIDTMPRETTLDTLTCTSTDFSGTLNYTYTTKDSALTHQIALYIEGNKDALFTSDTLTGTIALSNFVNTIYAALPNKNKGTLTLTLTTKYNSTTIGSSTKTITLSIPDTIIPTIKNNLTLTPVDKSFLLQSMNKVQVRVSASAGNGSSIQGYKIQVQSAGKTVYETQVSTTGSLIVNVGPFSQTGLLTFYVSAKDARGRWSGIVSKSISCEAYFLPSFSGFEVFRTEEDGEANPDGAFLTCSYSVDYTTNIDGNNNSITVKLFLDGTEKPDLIWSNGSTTFSLGDNTTTHEVYLTIEDNYYSGSNSAVKTVLPAERILNVASHGKGIAIGKKANATAQSTGLFECQWSAKFYENMVVEGNITADGLTLTGKGLFDMIYPVGSIYMSVNSTSPATLFGGTWVRIENTFLLAAGSGYTAGSTGGAATVTLTQDQTPLKSHTHTPTVGSASFLIRPPGNADRNITSPVSNTTTGQGDTNWTYGINTAVTANAKPEKVTVSPTVSIANASSATASAHNNMPPYLAVYMWKRTA